MNLLKPMLAIVIATWTGNVLADMTEARCDIYPRGSDKASAMISCTFGQRQGAITITRSDGVTHDLIPAGDAVGNFTDQHGHTVYRQGGLGRAGLIFRFPDESVYVYWSTTGLNPKTNDPDNPTEPYSTADYDATTLLRCGPVGSPPGGTCPAGILRMEGGQASIVITSPGGQEFTINFMTDYVNAAGRQVEATFEGDLWTVIVDGKEIYEVPIAAIEGG